MGLSLVLIFMLTISFMIIEFFSSIITHSLTLLADSFHMTTDVIALFLSLIAMWVARKPRDSVHSYGFKRAEVLAAFLNGIFLIIISIYLGYKAFIRFNHSVHIESELMVLVAILGLIINFIGIFLLKNKDKNNLNIHGAFLHILGDAFGSLGAIIAAIIIFFTKDYWVDTVISFLITIFIIISGLRLFKDSLHILMEGTPKEFDLKEIESSIMKSVPEVEEIHDLHVWTINSGDNNLSCHIRIHMHTDCVPILTKIQTFLRNVYGINHSTIQMEHCLPESIFECEKC